MTPQQIAIVQSTWEQIYPNANVAATMFYTRLFELDPTLRRLFPGDLRAQYRKLVAAIGLAVRSLGNPDRLGPVLDELGRRHAGYGVKDPHYSTVGVALVDTLAAGLGDGFTPAVQEAWAATYAVIAETMKNGAAQGRPVALAR